jgi:hypothetical protein
VLSDFTQCLEDFAGGSDRTGQKVSEPVCACLSRSRIRPAADQVTAFDVEDYALEAMGTVPEERRMLGVGQARHFIHSLRRELMAQPFRRCSKLCSDRVVTRQIGHGRTESRSEGFRRETARIGTIR